MRVTPYMEKTCKQCGYTGLDFRKGRRICHTCQKAWGKAHYHAHCSPDELKERTTKQLERRAQNPIPWMLASCKARAKKFKLEFNLEKEDISIPEICPVLGIKLMMAKGRMNHNSPTLDRINNALGYVKGNVHVISWRANALKNNATADEIKLILDYMLKHEKNI